jgi:hypothetical protein
MMGCNFTKPSQWWTPGSFPAGPMSSVVYPDYAYSPHWQTQPIVVASPPTVVHVPVQVPVPVPVPTPVQTHVLLASPVMQASAIPSYAQPPQPLQYVPSPMVLQSILPTQRASPDGRPRSPPPPQPQPPFGNVDVRNSTGLLFTSPLPTHTGLAPVINYITLTPQPPQPNPLHAQIGPSNDHGSCHPTKE